MKPALLFLLIILLLSFLGANAQVLDSTFGVNGIQAIYTPYSDNTEIYSSAIQNDGSIIASGVVTDDYDYYPDAFIWHLTADGQIDEHFGNGGSLYIASRDGYKIDGVHVVLQPDGKIVGAGGTTDRDGGTYSKLYIFRKLPNGDPDTTFGNKGESTIDFGGHQIHLGTSNIALRSDGKILLSTEAPASCMIQFMPNGAIDSSFGTNGIVTGTVPYNEFFGEVKILADDKVICVNTYRDKKRNLVTTFGRYNENGEIDSTYGTNGFADIKARIEFHFGFGMFADESIIMAASSDSDVNNQGLDFYRIDKDGHLIKSFGKKGVYKTQTHLYTNVNIIPQDDGSFIMNNPEARFAIVKYKANGRIDGSFGNHGKASANFDYFVKRADGAFDFPLLQYQNKIVAVGYINEYIYALPFVAFARFTLENALPLNLLSFTATKQNNSVLLNWQTTNEVNNNYFSVEKSSDGNHFSSIGNVISKGNSTQMHSYSFVDAKPFNGNNFYRLKQVDKNGKFTYSSVVNADFNFISLIKIYPNPAKDILNITGLNSSSTATISIVDASGKIVLQKNISGENCQLNISSLHAGNYFARIESDNKTTTIKFVRD